MKNHTKLIILMTFHTKPYLVHNHFKLHLVKEMNLLEFMMKLDI